MSSRTPIWCVVAEVLPTNGGTRHFAAGDSVYLLPTPADTGIMKVVGLHRTTHRYLTVFINADQLTNWQVVPVNSPPILAELSADWDDTDDSKQRAEMLAQQLRALYN